MQELMFGVHLSTVELLQLFLANSQDGCVVLQEYFLASLNNLQSADCDVFGISQSKPNKIEHLQMCTAGKLYTATPIV